MKVISKCKSEKWDDKHGVESFFEYRIMVEGGSKDLRDFIHLYPTEAEFDSINVGDDIGFHKVA
jgi:hypothetical protein